MTLRVTLQPTFVLHSRPYRDTSSIVDLFTLSHGRISAVARNARGQRSRFRGSLRAFVPILTTWSGKGELMNLSAVESNGPAFELTGHALLSGFYLNELLVKLLHRYDPHPQLFMSYQKTLANIANNEQRAKSLRLFEKKLLDELGYGLQLNKEAITGVDIIADQKYYFDPQHGIRRSWGTADGRNIFQGKNLLAFHREILADKEDLLAAKKLMQIAIESLLGSRPKSRELFVSPK